MHYRLYQPGDFEPLYAIEEACFQPPLRFPRGYMRRLVTSTKAATWIAEDNGRLAGFAIVEWSADEFSTVAYIQTLEVAEDQRGKGIGTELLRRMESSARQAGASIIWLHVDAENAGAIRLYEAHGYRFEGRQEGYYTNRRDALIYAKRLNGDGGDAAAQDKRPHHAS
jgi:ribosomal protein S18 acetylase RimI-like enzyme